MEREVKTETVAKVEEMEEEKEEEKVEDLVDVDEHAVKVFCNR